MKKTFRLLGLSALVLGLAVACNNNQPVEAAVDSVIDEVVEEEPIEDVTIDSALMAEEETPAPATDNKKKATTTKKTNKGVSTTDEVKVSNTAVATKATEEPVKAAEASTSTKENTLDKRATKAQQKMRR